MKVEVSKLKPNPYRRIDEYQIDKEKVAELKMSISDTSFWDNLLARKHGNEFQIAYGHHRLEALKELKIKEIDIPVRDIDDGMMIKIMANENRDTYKANRSVMIETIKVARDFLREQIGKLDSWDDYLFLRKVITDEKSLEGCKGSNVSYGVMEAFLGKGGKINPLDFKPITLHINKIANKFKDYSDWKLADRFITELCDSKQAFANCKAQGIGRDAIKSFLGGNWKEWEIQEALAQLDVDKAKIEPKALDQFESLSTAREARQVFQEFKIPKSKQAALAKELVKKEVPVKQMRLEVANVAWREGYTKPQKIKEKEARVLPAIDDFVSATMGQIGQTISGLEKLQGNLKNVKSKLTLMMFNTTMKSLKRQTDAIVEELETLKTNKGESDGKTTNLPADRKRIS